MTTRQKKTARLILYGGWSDEWLSDLYTLDVSAIVGPPYAVQSLEPADGPMTGGTLLTIKGLNFYMPASGNGEVNVKFVSGKHEESVDGELVSPFEIRVRSPSWEGVGEDDVDVRVSLGGEAFTVNKVRWRYYVNTMPEQCLAYGPGILSPCFWGLPAKFRVQARDSSGKNRTSGLDAFEVKARRRLPLPDDPNDAFDCDGNKIEFEDLVVDIEDMHDGSYHVTYLPSIQSEYLVEVRLEGRSIRGGPWPLETHDPWMHSIKVLSPSNAPLQLANVGYSVQGTRLVIFGGSTAALSVLDLQAFRWDAPTIASGLPKPRIGHAMMGLDHEKSIILFGNKGLVDGVEQGYCDDMHLVSGDKTGWRWTPLSKYQGSDTPLLRTNAAACLLPGGARKLFVNGGLSQDGVLLDESYVLHTQNPAKVEWKKLKNVVSQEYMDQYLALQAATNDLDAVSAVFALKTAMEGGKDSIEPNLPRARQQHHVFAFDKSVGLFGGVPFSNDVIIGEIRENEGFVEWHVANVGGNAPTPRRNCHACAHEGQLLVYGGFDVGGKQLDDIFMLDTKAEESEWKWQCLYMSDMLWIGAHRVRSLGVVAKGKLVVLLGAKGAAPCEEIHVLEYEKLLELTTVNGKMAEQIIEDLAAVQTFLKTESDVLNQEIPSAAANAPAGDDEDVDQVNRRRKIGWEIFGSLYRLEQNGAQVALTLDILQDVLDVLRKSGLKFELLGQDLSDCVEMWKEISRLAPKVNENTQWMRSVEMVRLREDVSKLDEKVLNYGDMIKKRAAFTFVMNVENAFRDIAEIYREIEELHRETEELEYESTVFGVPEQVENSVRKLRGMSENLVAVRQLWCFIALYDSYLHWWGHTRWSVLDCAAAKQQFADLLDLVTSFVSEQPAQRDWDVFLDLRLNLHNLLTSFEILRGLQQVYIRDRHWSSLKEILSVRSLPHNDESFMLQNLLALDVFTFEDDVNDLLLRAKSEYEMEDVLGEIATAWSDAELVFEHNEALNSIVASLSPDLAETLETQRVQISMLMNSKFLDAVLREDPNGVVTFEKEVRHWESELWLVAEATLLLDQVQAKWKNLTKFYIQSRDVPKALPEATERFLLLDRQIREFLVELARVKKVTAASNQDFVLSLRLEAFLDDLEEGEETLVAYARTKRAACSSFYLLSLAEILETIGNDIAPGHTLIDFQKIRSSIACINIYHIGATPHALSWGSRDGAETVAFRKEVVLEMGLLDNFKAILAEVGQSLFKRLSQAVEVVATAPSTSWFLEYPNQVVLCATRIHFYRSMELGLDNLASGDAEAIERLLKVQNAQILDCTQLLHTHLKKDKRTILQNMMLLHLHMCDLAESFKLEEPGGTESFAWKYQVRVRWRQHTDDNQKDNVFADPGEQKKTEELGVDCFLECGDRSLRYLHDYLGPTQGAVVTMQTNRVFVSITQAICTYRGSLVLSAGTTGKTETICELATLAGTHVEVVQCTAQMDMETVVNIFCGLTSNCAWGCLRNFHTLAPNVVAVFATYCNSVLQALAERRNRCTFGSIDNIPLNAPFGFFILWPSTINSVANCPGTIHPSMKRHMRPVLISEPDLKVVLRFMLTTRGFKSAAQLSVKIAQVAAFGRGVLKGLRKVDWGLRVFKQLVSTCFRIRTEGRWGVSPVDENELFLWQREILHHFEMLVDTDSRLMLREFVSDIFDKNGANADKGSNQSAKSQKIAQMLIETSTAKLRCSDLAAEQMLDLEVSIRIGAYSRQCKSQFLTR